MKRFGFIHLSTGDILRAEVNSGSDLGTSLKTVMDRGEVVSDEIMIRLIREHLVGPRTNDRSFREQRVILDGFPRTLTQSLMLSDLMNELGSNVYSVLELSVEDSLLVRRICGRRIHVSSGRSYHIEFNPSKIEGKDDITGEPLVQRSDDNEETLKKRLEVYHLMTGPVLDYYRSQGKLISIDASRSANEVYAAIEKILSPILDGGSPSEKSKF